MIPAARSSTYNTRRSTSTYHENRECTPDLPGPPHVLQYYTLYTYVDHDMLYGVKRSSKIPNVRFTARYGVPQTRRLSQKVSKTVVGGPQVRRLSQKVSKSVVGVPHVRRLSQKVSKSVGVPQVRRLSQQVSKSVVGVQVRRLSHEVSKSVVGVPQVRRLSQKASKCSVGGVSQVRPTIVVPENRKQNKFSLHRTETREQYLM